MHKVGEERRAEMGFQLTWINDFSRNEWIFFQKMSRKPSFLQTRIKTSLLQGKRVWLKFFLCFKTEIIEAFEGILFLRGYVKFFGNAFTEKMQLTKSLKLPRLPVSGRQCVARLWCQRII